VDEVSEMIELVEFEALLANERGGTAETIEYERNGDSETVKWWLCK